MKAKKYTLLTTILLFTVGTLVAQHPQNKPKVEQMHEQKWQHIVENAQLSAKEIETVRPVFLEYEKSIWDLFQKNRENYRKARPDSNEKPNYAELNEQLINHEIKQVQLLKSYHQKLTKLLPPETLFNYYRAERAYKRKLLQNMPPRHQQGGNR
jgi:hypothetical protein